MANLKRYRCRAKDVMQCPYHGAAIRIEEAAEAGDYNAYQVAKREFETAAGKLRVHAGLLSAFTGEEAVPNPALSPANPMRFTASLEINPREDSNATLQHRIDVYAATREAAIDKLVHATKAYVDELRASKQRLSWKRDDYTYVAMMPDLDGRKDDDMNGGGGTIALNQLVGQVGFARELAVRAFNTRALVGKKADHALTPAEARYYNHEAYKSSTLHATEEDWLDPKYAAVNTVWQGESERERQKRHQQADWYRDVRRQRAREERVARERADRRDARAARLNTGMNGGDNRVTDDYATQQNLLNATLLASTVDSTPAPETHPQHGGYDHTPSPDPTPSYDSSPSYDGGSYTSDGGSSGGGDF